MKKEILQIVRPILFNTDMVRAILDDRKTATRRSIKGDIILRLDMEHKVTFLPHEPKKDGKSIKYFTLESFIEHETPYQKGDILYVRETWANLNTLSCPCYYYKASDNLPEWALGGWKPSIHMPKEATRIWTKVTNVRVERLWDMKLDDFLSEGVVIRPEAYNDPENAYWQAKQQFIDIWDNTFKTRAEARKYCWAVNPWVWVIEFERCEKPECWA